MDKAAARAQLEHAQPILCVAEMSRSLAYYTAVLGFTNAEWGDDDFTCVHRDGAAIYLARGEQGNPGTWVWVGVSDVAVLHEEYSASGAVILEPPTEYGWAYEMKVKDPDGHVLRIGSAPRTGRFEG
jgi:predicted lactoylglutathione lyase